MNLSSEDFVLFREAYDQYEHAMAVLTFLGNHFQRKYELPPNAKIHPDGRIEIVSDLERKQLVSDATLSQNSVLSEKDS